jgi:hypothetical protein
LIQARRGDAISRLDDGWGVRWFNYVFSPALMVCATGGASLDDESGVEVDYDAKFADHIRFTRTPIWPGTRGKSTALFLGLRGRLVF